MEYAEETLENNGDRLAAPYAVKVPNSPLMLQTVLSRFYLNTD
jgi:hypothetical protein